MSNAHFFEDAPPEPRIATGRGGYRPNGGRKKGGKNAPQTPNEDGEKLSAFQRHEIAKADKAEHDARIAQVKADLDEKRVVDRQSVRDATAEAFAACSQSMDAIPDALERNGVPIDVCLQVGELINAAKAQLAKDLEEMNADAGGDDEQ